MSTAQAKVLVVSSFDNSQCRVKQWLARGGKVAPWLITALKPYFATI